MARFLKGLTVSLMKTECNHQNNRNKVDTSKVKKILSASAS